MGSLAEESGRREGGRGSYSGLRAGDSSSAGSATLLEGIDRAR